MDGDVCDTSDRFKQPGKYFDNIKKEFECDFLFESDLEVPRIIDEQFDEENPAFVTDITEKEDSDAASSYYEDDEESALPAHDPDNAEWVEQEDGSTAPWE